MKGVWLEKGIVKMLCLSFLICVSTLAFAQGTITGKVVDRKDNRPIEGVTVQVKGTTTTTSTKSDGTFSIKAPPTATLIATFVGYTAQELRLNNRTSITIEIEESAKTMDDVVVIGYQSVQRRNTSAAISSVKGKDFENTPYPTFDAMLQGRVAGLTVLGVSGEPGGNNVVNIRGNTAVNNADGNLGSNGISTPLYVIDGLVFDVNDNRSGGNGYNNNNPLAAINPNDIESIDVLKDASAAAIYGARAANGVIIVKTKRPKGGKPQLRFSSYVGLATRPALKPVTVGQGERRLKYDMIAQANNYTLQRNISQMLSDSLNPSFNNNTDFQEMSFTDGLIQNYDLSIAGADERFAYRLSFNKYGEQGVTRGFRIDRISPRLFLSLKPYKGIEITTDLYMGFVKSLHGSGVNGADPFPYSVQNFPTSFWRIDSINRASYEGRNSAVRDDDRATSINGNTRLIAKLSPAFTLTSSLSYNFNFNRRDYLRPRNITGNTSNATNFSYNSRRYEIENYLTYSRSFKEHSFTGLVGTGVEDNVNNTTDATGNAIPLDAIFTINGVAPGPNLNVSTSFQERTRVSLFTRVGYSFKGRYGVDLSYRRDASSRYAKSSQWGEFPAASARWTISEEPFFKPLLKYISFLKFRASYGSTGRDPGSYYAQYRTLGINGTYVSSNLGFGASGNVLTYNGVSAVRPNYTAAAPATNITWERSPQSNVGVDVNFLKDRFTLTFEYYRKNSKDIVFNIPVPITTGYTTATNNYVDVRNEGVEFTLTTNNLSKQSKVKWTTQINLAFNDNYVTRLPGGNRDFLYGPVFFQRILTVGRPLHSFLVWNANGVYPSTADVPVDPLTGLRIRQEGGNFYAGGNAARQDLNGDYNITPLDKIIAGDPAPRMTGGIINNVTFKGFSLQLLSTFITGRKLWNGYLSDKLAAATNDNYSTFGRFAGPAIEFQGLNIWQQPGDVADIPGLFGRNLVDDTNISSGIFVQDASFFRVKSLLLGYTLPSKLTDRLRLKNVRVYSNIDNLKTFYTADVPDPEGTAVDGVNSGRGYPLSKKFTFGLEINL
jgi:TonB-linked SusC/RagA family outer membrane protein